jgi:drug/metabolite transporter (DMT)-like permease
MNPSGLLSRHTRDSAITLLVISSVLWGSTFVGIKIGIAYVNVYDFVFLRIAIASVVLLFSLTLFGGFKPAALKETSVWVLGLLNGVAFSLQYVGMQFTTAAKTALLVDVNVIIVALLSHKIFQEPFGLRKKFGVILGLFGAVMITTNGDVSSLAGGELLGDILVFAAGLVWAFFIIFHKRVLNRTERTVMEMSAFVMLTTAILLFPLAAMFGGLNLSIITIDGWSWIGFTAIVCTVLPYAFWIFALKKVTATMVSVVGMLEIAVAMILSALFLGEAFGVITLLGAGLILLSIPAVTEN